MRFGRREYEKDWYQRDWAKGLRIFAFMESRKVSFGAWILVLATYLCVKGRIDGGNWIAAVTIVGVMIGAGTVADKLADVAQTKADTKKAEVENALDDPLTDKPPKP